MAVLLCVIFSFLVLAYFAKGLPDITDIAQKHTNPQITILDTNGVVLAKYGDYIGNALTYSQIPLYTVQALISAEDRRFFDHFGVDAWGILRAMLQPQNP